MEIERTYVRNYNSWTDTHELLWHLSGFLGQPTTDHIELLVTSQ